MKRYIRFVFNRNDLIKARAYIKSSDKTQDYGYIDFIEDIALKQTKIICHIRGLKINKDQDQNIHAIHIHEFNNDMKCCSELGGHYNPLKKEHGGRTIEVNGTTIINPNRHVGDLGNIEVDTNGNCDLEFVDPMIHLSGLHSVMNRSVVIHRDKDDLGLGGFDDSKITGHAGERIAYGLIQWIC